jgi:amidase
VKYQRTFRDEVVPRLAVDELSHIGEESMHSQVDGEPMLRRVEASEIEDIARAWHFKLDKGSRAELHTLTEFAYDVLNTLFELPEPEPEPVPAQRDAGRAATREEDPYNAVVRWCSVRIDGAEGPLTGRRIGVKDSIAVAGVPLTAGSRVLGDFTPREDSAIARRVLDAGGEIVATLNMDDLAFSGGGDTSAHGPTLCPFDTSRTAAGSSGGSGAALHYDDVDITIGCDQGGSIRAPAAWSGVIGLKPTYGLVPYVGVVPIDHPIDHAGPMARTAEDAALLLTVLAGKDPRDPRQPATVPVIDYARAVAQARDDLRGTSIGVVREGFAEKIGVDDRSKAAVGEALERLRELGAETREVSIPEHLRARGIALAGSMQGLAAVIEGGGNGFGWRGRYWPELAHAFAEGMRDRGHEFSPEVMVALICGTHLRRHYAGEIYARAHNLHSWLRGAYDRALADLDVLVMPTTPGLPHVYDPGLSISQRAMRGWAVLSNTGPMDSTGHPAISLPAAEADGLPVGLMVVGRHFEDDRLLALAQTYEQRFGWRPEAPPDSRTARWDAVNV